MARTQVILVYAKRMQSDFVFCIRDQQEAKFDERYWNVQLDATTSDRITSAFPFLWDSNRLVKCVDVVYN